MAIHNDLNSMAREAIPEFLHVARMSIDTQKPTGGVYGCPAVLLLFSVVDAISNFSGYPQHSFGALGDILPHLNLTQRQIQSLAHWYRHPMSHQGILAPGVAISIDDPGPAIELNSSGEPTHIRLNPFYKGVKAAWDAMDHATIEPKVHPQAKPKEPLASTTVSVSASGKLI